MIVAGDLERAREAADELASMAGPSRPSVLSALAAHAQGAVLLASGDAPHALESLRQAWEAWHDLEMPYEQAEARVLTATAARRVGDRAGATIELDAARKLFSDLGAGTALASLGSLSASSPRPAAGPLSEREAQVLRLIAAGKTNRAIGEELFIAEKTVARHVSNIFDKLGVSTRAAATAWAYERHLL
jgi:DNA-binding NarL/FixJ family response regulator